MAGTHSGVGKTSVATGLLAALAGAGHRVASAKVGPDFIDPGYHAVATGRAGRNLDAWICGAGAIAPLAGRAGAGADLLVVEGVMGLFDGAASAVPGAVDPTRDDASTAHVARLLDAPVVLVVDGSSMSASVAAVVHGFATLDPDVRIAGVILNRVASDGHDRLLREAIEPLGIPVVGSLRRDDTFAWRDRHLGLVPVVEHPDQVRRSVDALAATVRAGCDLDTVVRLARDAPATVAGQPLPAARSTPGAPSPPIAVAGGRAFSFSYPENIERLVEAGAEIVPFDPLHDEAVPADVAGLVAGGGFPEVFGAELAANTSLLADVRARVAAGLPTWAECGGLLWLARSLDGRPMAGAIEADAGMTDHLTLGYREVTTLVDTPIAGAGTPLRGHEFHYSTIEPNGDALALRGRFGNGTGGFASPALLASYVHLHLGADTGPAERFVAGCRAHLATSTGGVSRRSSDR